MADRRPGMIGRTAHHAWRWLADKAEDRTAKAAGSARSFTRDAVHGRFRCACSPGKEFRSHRALNAHHLARHGGYWGGKKARDMGRKLGRVQDAARRHARGWREAHGLIGRDGRLTDRGRSRPQHRGRLGLAQMRELHRHDRDHERARRHDGRAARHEARGRMARAHRHQDKARGLRDRWPARTPPAPSRPSPAANGRTPQAARAPGPPPRGGRLAPGNGRTPAPARTGRTRT